jgi:hypothetical protein
MCTTSQVVIFVLTVFILLVKVVVLMPQLPGNQHITYQLQYRKCGKPSCRTCRSSQGHGPYWYAYWREGSQLRSTYIGKARPASLDSSLDSSTPDSTMETVSGVAIEGPDTVGGRSAG